MTKITNVETLAEYAERHGLDVKRLRRLARKNEWPGDVKPFKFGSVWAIDTNAPGIELPAKSKRGNRRTDGRQRYIVYANDGERTAVTNIVGDDNIVDPRVASKLRRAKRAIDMENAVENERAKQIVNDAHEIADGMDG